MGNASPEDLERVLASMETRRFGAGDVIVRHGDDERALYLLVDGTLLERSGRGARRLEPSALFGETGFLSGQPATETVVAETAGEALRLGFEAFEALAARHPRLGRDLLLELGRIVALRLRALAASGD